MDGASEFQVAAETDGHVVQSSFQALDREQVGQRLGRVLMSAVARVDHRNRRVLCSNHRRAFLRVSHCADVSIAGDHTDRICNAFTLGSGTGVCGSESHHTSSQIQHGCLVAQTGSGARFIEESRQLLSLAGVGIFCRICFDILCNVQQFVKFFH